MSARWLTCLIVLLSGCVSERVSLGPSSRAPVSVATPNLHDRAAQAAASLVGVPYRYGGATPDGFDCSGLVWYAYHSVGLDVPRTAAEQRSAARAVGRDALQPGDLVFFRTPADHVGIYLGGDEFVHAPSTGRSVEKTSLHSPYFLLGYAGAGRFTP